jgi:hypothetical protein
MEHPTPDICSSSRNKPPVPAQSPVPADGTSIDSRRTVVTKGELDAISPPSWCDAGVAHPAETRWRHGHWQAQRDRVRKSLVAAGVRPGNLEKFDNCGARAQTFWSERDQRFTLHASYCKNRHCQPCMRSKARLIANNLRKRLQERARGRYRFITATIAHSDRPLEDQVKHLFDSFRRLRASACWKTQRGGAIFFECKIGDDGRWHPHIHAISEGAFLPREQLADAWHKATGDSYVIDVRAVVSEENVCHEVTKYITKGTSRNVWDDEQLAAEWIRVSKGVRACGTFGSWRGLKLTEKGAPDPDAEYLGSLVSLLNRQAAGDRVAAAILTALQPPGIGDESSCVASKTTALAFDTS